MTDERGFDAGSMSDWLKLGWEATAWVCEADPAQLGALEGEAGSDLLPLLDRYRERAGRTSLTAAFSSEDEAMLWAEETVRHPESVIERTRVVPELDEQERRALRRPSARLRQVEVAPAPATAPLVSIVDVVPRLTLAKPGR